MANCIKTELWLPEYCCPNEEIKKESTEKWPVPYEEVTVMKTEVKEEAYDFPPIQEETNPLDMKVDMSKYLLFPGNEIKLMVDKKLPTESPTALVCSSCKMEILGANPFLNVKCCEKSDLQLKKKIVIGTLERIFKCDRCSYTTDRKWFLERHSRVHSNEKLFKCTYKVCKCTESPTREVPCECEICPYAAADKSSLKVHVLVKHSNEDKKYKCTFCKFSSHLKGNFVRHLRTHTNDKRFKCGYENCTYESLRRYLLTKHIRHHHTHENYFNCDECEFATTYREVLKRHVLQKHSNEEKQYKCTDCKYSSHKKGNLMCHMFTHTKEKHFKCDLCEFATAYKSTLKNHVLQKHSNEEKKHKCNDCQYSSHKKEHLIRHMRSIHTNEKPYKCSVCKFVTVYRKVLSNHILDKHNGEEK